MKKTNTFIWRLLLTAIILFTIVILDNLGKINYDDLKQSLSSEINVLKILQKMNGEKGLVKIFEINGIDDLPVIDEFENKEQIENGYRYYPDDYEGVTCKVSGVVVNINYDGLYKVVILDSNDNKWIYDNLLTFDYRIYSFIETNSIIGTCDLYYDVCVV